MKEDPALRVAAAIGSESFHHTESGVLPLRAPARVSAIAE
jgi:hypothetical protein